MAKGFFMTQCEKYKILKIKLQNNSLNRHDNMIIYTNRLLRLCTERNRTAAVGTMKEKSPSDVDNDLVHWHTSISQLIPRDSICNSSAVGMHKRCDGGVRNSKVDCPIRVT